MNMAILKQILQVKPQVFIMWTHEGAHCTAQHMDGCGAHVAANAKFPCAQNNFQREENFKKLVKIKEIFNKLKPDETQDNG